LWNSDARADGRLCPVGEDENQMSPVTPEQRPTSEFAKEALLGADAIEAKVAEYRSLVQRLVTAGISVGNNYTKPALVEIPIDEKFVLKVIKNAISRFPRLSRAMGLRDPRTSVDALTFIARYVYADRNARADVYGPDDGPPKVVDRGHGARLARQAPGRPIKPEAADAASPSPSPKSQSRSPASTSRPDPRQSSRLAAKPRVNYGKGNERVDFSMLPLVPEQPDPSSSGDAEVDAVACFWCYKEGHYQSECDLYKQAKQAQGLPLTLVESWCFLVHYFLHYFCTFFALLQIMH
jgi:hypothetical protein